jgi:thiamine biosynthesis lipoprotein
VGGLAAVLLVLCTPAGPVRVEAESKHMGTAVRVVVYAADKPAGEAAAKAAFARIAEVEQALSDYKPDSELMRLCKANDAMPGVPRPVGSDLLAVLDAGQKLAAKSGGAFDVTVGPVVRLWRLARRTQQLPDAKGKVGYRKVTLDPAAKTVTLESPGMRLDFGGIGKGYAADQALAVIRDKHGNRQALVAVAGDIAAGDPPPGRDGWAVDIAPLAAGRPARSLVSANKAVSTSGDLEQFVEIGGVRYSHVLDPRTGVGLTGRRSVTVVAPKGIDADSLTKVASVLPPDLGLKLLADYGAAGLIVRRDGDGPEAVVKSTDFPLVRDGTGGTNR